MNHVRDGAAGAIVYDGYDSWYNHHGAWGYWGLLAYNQSTGAYTPRKRFYTAAQMYRHVPPGSVRVQATAGGAGLRVFAFHHAGSGRVTIVGRNSNGGAVTLNGTLLSLPAVATLELYQTTTSLSMQRGADVAVSGGSFSVQVAGDSVFTLTGAGSGGGNPPPTVSITSPANGASFAAPATISIAAIASDSNGTVTKVEFFQGTTKLGEDLTSPYSFAWLNVAAGTYTLTAVATDNGLATATSAPVTVTVTAGSLPAPWLHQDVGAVGVAGGAGFASGAFTVDGSGADIWNAADGFHFVFRPLAGDGQVTARVASQENTDPWAKAGVMIRETLAAGSRHAMTVVTPGNGSAFQRRVAAGGASTGTAGPSLGAPAWVRLVRSGNTFTAYVSPDGTAWTLVGSDIIAMGSDVSAGLAVTAHNTATLSTAVFDNVSVSSGSDTDGDGLPDSWELANFGNLSQTAGGDADGDTLTNGQELALGTNPLSADTDGDGTGDAQEIAAGTDPLNPASVPGGGGAPPPSSGGDDDGCGGLGFEAILLIVLIARFRFAISKFM